MFNFNKGFLSKQERRKATFGFAGLGETTFLRTYSHTKPDGTKESWLDVVERCTRGAWNMALEHRKSLHLSCDSKEVNQQAENMLKDMFDMRFLPPGRGLWAMGKPVTTEKRLFAALNNCGFVSTEDIDKEGSEPFTFLMDASMLGVGIGFDSLGSGKLLIKGPAPLDDKSSSSDDEKDYAIVKPDTPRPKATTFKDVICKKCHSEGKRESLSCLVCKSGRTFILGNVHCDGCFDMGYRITNSCARCVRPADLEVFEPAPDQLLNVDEVKKMTGNDRMYARPSLAEVKLEQKSSFKTKNYIIADTREGWVDSLRVLLDSFFHGKAKPVFDYSKLRLKGEPLKTFGGVSSGPEPLEQMHKDIDSLLTSYIGKQIDTRVINDIMNMIGRCVVSGNIRRSAEISLGNPNDEVFLNLKNANVFPDRQAFAWAANNSICADIGMDYSKMVERVAANGEPGFVWLENAKDYGIMSEPKNGKDHRVKGVNPCLTADTMICVADEKGDGIELPIKELIGKQFAAFLYGDAYLSTKEGFWSNGIKKIFEVKMDNKRIIKSTDNHKFFNHKTNKWQELKDFKEGDCFQDISNNPVKIISITPAGEEEVYDCTIPKRHFFEANGILSHNCSEQSLESYELCCLVEVFPFKCPDKESFMRALKNAYTYAKIVTLGTTHWTKTNAVLLRNRRIGVSVTGLAQCIETRGLHSLKTWLSEGYNYLRTLDKEFSEWLAIPQSVKLTSVKPSGSISLLAGATPGMHYPESRYYIRRIRIGADDPILKPIKEAGYFMEPDKYTNGTMCVEFIIDSGDVRPSKEVSMWEQVQLASFLQAYWSDNQVSATITFSKKEKADLVRVLEYGQYHLKGISFLPRIESEDGKKPYEQMPYEALTRDQYNIRIASLKSLDFSKLTGAKEAAGEDFCGNDYCGL